MKKETKTKTKKRCKEKSFIHTHTHKHIQNRQYIIERICVIENHASNIIRFKRERPKRNRRKEKKKKILEPTRKAFLKRNMNVT